MITDYDAVESTTPAQKVKPLDTSYDARKERARERMKEALHDAREALERALDAERGAHLAALRGDTQDALDDLDGILFRLACVNSDKEWCR